MRRNYRKDEGWLGAIGLGEVGRAQIKELFKKGGAILCGYMAAQVVGKGIAQTINKNEQNPQGIRKYVDAFSQAVGSVLLVKYGEKNYLLRNMGIGAGMSTIQTTIETISGKQLLELLPIGRKSASKKVEATTNGLGELNANYVNGLIEGACETCGAENCREHAREVMNGIDGVDDEISGAIDEVINGLSDEEIQGMTDDELEGLGRLIRKKISLRRAKKAVRKATPMLAKAVKKARAIISTPTEEDEEYSEDEEMEGFDEEINGYNEISGYDDEIDGVDDEIDGVDDEIDGIDDEIDGVDDEIDGIDDEIDGIDDEIDGIDDADID